jgi:DNA-binding MurR/RpiR family transcriptional regulator
VFARQVQAHGRPGDVLVLMSTSGRSANLLRAAEAGHAGGLRVWTMTGRRPNPLADAADETLDIEAPRTATVQEAHLLALHLLCELFDEARAERAALQTNGSARVRRVNGSALVNGSDGVDGVDGVDRVDGVDGVDGSDRRDGTDREWIRR